MVKNWQFFHRFILGKLGKENVFHDNHDNKKEFKKSKNWDFSKELVHGTFRQKLTFFPSFYFKKIAQE